MSVDMCIIFKNEEQKSILIPVAGAGTFTKYWETPSIELDLTLIPLLSRYIEIEENNNAKLLLNELEALKEYIQENKSNIPNHKFKEIVERIDKISRMILETLEDWEEVKCINFG